jgi:hypothetical protein
MNAPRDQSNNLRPSAKNQRSSASSAGQRADQTIGENQCPSVVKRGNGWGGRRPGAGAPRGNTNALKHGRTSRRQAQLLEAALDIPQVRQTLIDFANRERRRRKKAEEGYGVMMTRLLEKVAAAVHSEENDQGQNNQEFLDFLNTVTAEMRKILEKPSRRRRITINPVLSGPPGRVEGRPPQADALTENRPAGPAGRSLTPSSWLLTPSNPSAAARPSASPAPPKGSPSPASPSSAPAPRSTPRSPAPSASPSPGR